MCYAAVGKLVHVLCLNTFQVHEEYINSCVVCKQFFLLTCEQDTRANLSSLKQMGIFSPFYNTFIHHVRLYSNNKSLMSDFVRHIHIIVKSDY